MKKSMKLLTVAGLTALVATPVFADDHKYEVTGAVGHYFFDEDREAKNNTVYGVGFGYVVDPQWTVEAWWQQMDTGISHISDDLDVTQYHLDGLYTLGQYGLWRPFVAFGAGEGTFKYSGTRDTETQLNAGVGFKRELTSNVDLRGDLRAYHSLDEEKTDMIASLGIAYKFGGTSAPIAAEPAPVSAAAPVDSDGDGVYDDQDKCPGTAANLKVDSVGCPIKLEKAVSIQLNVNFDNDSSVVKPEYFSEIQRVADFAKQYQDTQIEVQGHTDSRASDAYNQALSDRRASSVAKILVEQYGLSADRVSAKGYGEAHPIANNDTAEGRAANRRVVAELSAAETSLEQR